MEFNRRQLVAILIVVALAVIWNLRSTERVIDNPVIVVNEQGILEKESSLVLEPEARVKATPSHGSFTGNDREITRHVVKTMSGFEGLPITVYNLQKPLLPNARLLDFREFNGRLWFAGDAGLYSFDLVSERWFVKTREHGLPRDTAYGIERTNKGLLLDLLDWNEKGHLTNNLKAEFDGQEFLKTNLTKITAKNGGYRTPKLAPLKGGLSDYLQATGLDWYCVRGKHAGRGKGFEQGGVIMFNRETSQKTVFTSKDGMVEDHCTSITAASDRSIWTSHWDEEAGLSHLADDSNEWQIRLNSANGISLGGPSVHAYGDFLFIAQQRALVIYDPKTNMAIDITEDLGLSGFIVTDVNSSIDGRIWATSYRYTRGGKGQAASGLLSFKLSDVAQLFTQENLNDSLRNARKL